LIALVKAVALGLVEFKEHRATGRTTNFVSLSDLFSRRRHSADQPDTRSNQTKEKQGTHEEEQQVVIAASVLTPKSKKTEEQNEHSKCYGDSMNPILDAIENFILKVGQKL